MKTDRGWELIKEISQGGVRRRWSSSSPALGGGRSSRILRDPRYLKSNELAEAELEVGSFFRKKRTTRKRVDVFARF